MRRKYHLLDVFTDRPLTGNQLAVVLDSDGLDTARMQAIAREFNLPETIFVLPAKNQMNAAAVRIFTVARELPFAGHPTVGTAVLLGELRAPELLAREDISLVLEEAVGEVHCIVRHQPGRAPRASFTLPRLPEYVEQLGETAAIAAALGLEKHDIGFGAHVPARFSAGVPFAFVPVKDRDCLAKISLDAGPWAAAFGGKSPVYIYCADPEGKGHHYRARMFAPDMGISEDPATGSAAAAFAGVIMTYERPTDGDHTFIIEQGYEMGRPSQITLGLDVASGALTSASIGGFAIMVGQGFIEV
eukprot:gene12263-12350_t